MFLELKSGKTINLVHYSHIKVEDTDVVFYPAKGSLNSVREHYDTVEEAEDRYNELKDELVDG